ncbi:hypothetical protein BDD12DRAFT_807439 [Trichophaea hybrida]|nr:hypothetical protein BDD12DRAFT_807439 [Trichophaea hybrida]
MALVPPLLLWRFINHNIRASTAMATISPTRMSASCELPSFIVDWCRKLQQARRTGEYTTAAQNKGPLSSPGEERMRDGEDETETEQEDFRFGRDAEGARKQDYPSKSWSSDEGSGRVSIDRCQVGLDPRVLFWRFDRVSVSVSNLTASRDVKRRETLREEFVDRRRRTPRQLLFPQF